MVESGDIIPCISPENKLVCTDVTSEIVLGAWI